MGTHVTMESKKIALRKALHVAVLFTVVGSGIWGLRHVGRQAALDKLERAFEARGIGLDVGSSGISLRGVPSLYDACFSLLNDDHDDVCFERIEAKLYGESIRGGKFRLRQGDAYGARIQTSDKRLQEFLRARAGRDDGADSSSSERSELLAGLESLTLHSAEFRFDFAGAVLAGQLEDLSLVQGDSWRASGAGTLTEFSSSNELLQEIGSGFVNNRATLEALLDSPREVRELNFGFEKPVRVQATRDGIRHEVSGQNLRFEAPWRLHLPNTRATLDNGRLHASIENIAIEMGTWTTDLEKLYIASATITSPTLFVAEERARDRMKSLVRAGVRDDRPRAASSEPLRSAAPQEESPAPNPASALLDELRGRPWHDVLPRAIHLENFEVRIVEELPLYADPFDILFDLPVLAGVRSGAMTYALRVLQRQLDISLNGELFGDGDAKGSLSVQGVWNYERKRGDLTFDIVDLDLPQLNGGLRRIGLQAIDGVANTRISVRGSKRDGVEFETTSSLTLANLSLSRLKTPLNVGPYEVTTRHTLKRGSDGNLRFETQAGTLRSGDARVDLRIHADQISLSSAHLAQRFEIQLEIPDQNPMDLLRGIPRALLGPIEGIEMAGTYGQTLDFYIIAKGLSPEGKPLWEILPPHRSVMRDANLRLVSLPESVDVRRLNGPMQFVFRGPRDEMMRPMHLAPPSPNREYPSITFSTDGVIPAKWVRLTEMSFPLVATQLYREDSSFFTNTGINWLQMRRVLSEALTTGSLSRGASTISMQLVKNVFLSHERSIERKLQEMFLTYWMTRLVPKERILEVYMNVIELGPNINGFEEASQFYFGVSSRHLRPLEAAWLSSISPNPTRIGGGRFRGAIQPGSCTRCDRLAQALVQRGWLRPSELPAIGSEDGAPTSLPDGGFATQGGWDNAPLLEAIDGTESTSSDISRVAMDSRVMYWIRASRLPRGAGNAGR